MCQRHAYRTCPMHNCMCPGHGCICVQGTVVYVSRARLYMCPGHNHRTRLANLTETHFNQTIVGGRAAAFMIKFIILSVLARILTPLQHIVEYFCRLRRLSYYVVMLRYFFEFYFILSVMLLIGFVAGIVHGVLFRYILLLGL